MKMNSNIRNFCIIAHIDHGKSTLADRFLEITNTLSEREMKHGQMLDTMDIEQERGITIKLQPVRMQWKEHQLNLIDTPGHVDFSYEVSRSLCACEGAILVVDASQGIEAQTLANVHMALSEGLIIIPVLNKIDLPAANPDKYAQEISTLLGIHADDILRVSAKNGTNVDVLLDKIIEKIPSPDNNIVYLDDALFTADAPKALIFDSTFDTYRGVVCSVRVFKGTLKRGDTVRLMRLSTTFTITEVGYLAPKYTATDVLSEGEVGYIVTGLKNVTDARVGDTITYSKNIDDVPLPGYKEATPFVYAGIFPIDGDDFPLLRSALEKLALNDASLSYIPEHSGALGHGFRVGCLGLLHLDIVKERLEREHNLDILLTAPSVNYEVIMDNKEHIIIQNPSEMPEAGTYEAILEPWMKLTIITPEVYVGAVMKLCSEKRGIQKDIQYLNETRVELHFEIPMASIVTDFYNDLKSLSQGYASMSYENIENREGDLSRLDILLAGDKVDALSQIIYKPDAHRIGEQWCEKLKEIIPKAQFVIAIQAAIGGRIVARETISALRKDVTSGLYGGDYSRKRKLLEKQKKGKKRLKQFGRVSLPQEAFMALMKGE